METMTPIKAIRVYFEADNGRKVTMDEIKALSSGERMALAILAAKELSVELDLSQTPKS